MFDMRLRLPELMAEHKPEPIETAYRLSILSGGAISMTNAHALVEKKGATERVDMDTLRALCKVFRVGPEALLTEAPPPPDPPGGKERKRRKGKKPGRKRTKA